MVGRWTSHWRVWYVRPGENLQEGFWSSDLTRKIAWFPCCLTRCLSLRTYVSGLHVLSSLVCSLKYPYSSVRRSIWCTCKSLYVSPLGRNALYCCSSFGWRFDAFVNGDISMDNNVFLNSFHQLVSDSDWLTVHSLRQALNIREGSSVLLFSDGST